MACQSIRVGPRKVTRCQMDYSFIIFALISAMCIVLAVQKSGPLAGVVGRAWLVWAFIVQPGRTGLYM